MSKTTLKKHRYAVILVGGSGTRFWPKSRKHTPKQFIDIIGKTSLFQQTLKRVKLLVDDKNVYIVTNKAYRKTIKDQINHSAIPDKNILCEPSGKNTAPAVCWAASSIARRDSDAVMMVLPSDHLIEKPVVFKDMILKAEEAAQRDYLVTCGIEPTRAETGYGYLKITTKKVHNKNLSLVDTFTEKPDSKTAKRFLKNKQYYWNSGMFIFKASVILKSYETYLPKMFELFNKGSSQSFINKNWNKLKSISIDYGILEKAGNVAAVPVKNLGWSDLGSWQSLADVLNKDKSGNAVKGLSVLIDSTQNLVWSDKRLVAVVGVDDLVVVDTPDALLVCRKSNSQDVRKIVQVLNQNSSSFASYL